MTALALPDAAPAAVPRVEAGAAVLVEANTGKQLYGLAADRELPIASATKLMTALVTLEHVRHLGKTFAQNDYYASSIDSQIGLAPGERMSVHDLLIALLVPSADDAAEDLAFNLGGHSVNRFVTMMNTRARQLGLTHTHYTTPSGLDTPGNYSSASDLVMLARYLLSHHPFAARVVALATAQLRSGAHPRVVSNRNDLIGTVPWIHGVKTGHTLEAGYVLVGAGTRGRMTLLSAVLGTATSAARDAATLALLRYGFANFKLVTPVRAGAVLRSASVKYRPGMRADLVAGSTITDVLPRRANVVLQVNAPARLGGPRKRGSVIGEVEVLADGRPVARVPLLLARGLPAVSPLTIAGRFLTQPTTLVWLAVLLLVSSGIVFLWRARARGRESAGLEAA